MDDFRSKLKGSISPNSEIFKKIPVNKPVVDYSSINKSNNILRESLNNIADRKMQDKAREDEYREAVVSALQGIEKNTAILTEMNSILRENTDKQDQVFELMTEILAIMKASNKEEADNRFKAVMKKIVAVSDGVNSVQSLYTMANTVYTASQAMF